MRKWLFEQRKRKGMTQDDIASRAFIDRSYYSQIERGLRTPSIEVAKAVATVLDFNPATFFSDDLNAAYYQAVKDAPIVVAYCNLEFRYTWIFNPSIAFDPDSLIDKRDDELGDDPGLHELLAFKQSILQLGLPGRKTIYFQNPRARYCDVYGKPQLDETGKVIGVVTVATDITEVLEAYSRSDPNAESRRLQALHRYQILDTPPDEAFDRITTLAAHMFQAPIALVSLVDADRIWFKSHHGLDLQQVHRIPGLCASAILGNEPYILTDTLLDPRSRDNDLVAGEWGVRFYAGVPLTTHDQYHVGVLSILDTRPRTLSEQERSMLTLLGQIVMDEMELRLAAHRLNGLNQELLNQRQLLMR